MINKKNLMVSILISLIVVLTGFTILLVPIKTYNVLTVSLIIVLILLSAYLLYKAYNNRNNFKLDSDLIMGIVLLITSTTLIFKFSYKESVITLLIVILIIINVISKYRYLKLVDKKDSLVPYAGLIIMTVLSIFIFSNLLFEYMQIDISLGATLLLAGIVNLLTNLAFYQSLVLRNHCEVNNDY